MWLFIVVVPSTKDREYFLATRRQYDSIWDRAYRPHFTEFAKDFALSRFEELHEALQHLKTQNLRLLGQELIMERRAHADGS